MCPHSCLTSQDYPTSKEIRDKFAFERKVIRCPMQTTFASVWAMRNGIGSSGKSPRQSRHREAFAGGTAPAEHARVLQGDLPPAHQRKTLRSKRFPTTIQILRINSLNWLGKANKCHCTNGANRANLICLARPSTFSIQIPYQFMSSSYHRRPCRAALG